MEKNLKIIYLVFESNGQYDTYLEMTIMACDTEKLAKKFIKKIHAKERRNHKMLSHLEINSIPLMEE